MGNGSIHGKDSERTEKPPKGSRIIGEGGEVSRFEDPEEGKVEAAAKKQESEKQ